MGIDNSDGIGFGSCGDATGAYPSSELASSVSLLFLLYRFSGREI